MFLVANVAVSYGRLSVKLLYHFIVIHSRLVLSQLVEINYNCWSNATKGIFGLKGVYHATSKQQNAVFSNVAFPHDEVHLEEGIFL